MSGKVKAFARYGVTLKNDQWSWSGISADGEVVVTLWRDEFDYKTKPVSYSNMNSPTLSEWMHRPGNHDRIEHLRYARENREGKFRVVMATAVDVNAEPRTIAEAYPTPNIVMRLVELDEETGAFRAVMEESNPKRT